MTPQTRSVEAAPPAHFQDFKNSFEKDGFVIVDFGFPARLIDETADFLRNHDWGMSSPDKNQAVYHGIRVQDAWKSRECVKKIALHAPVLDFLNQLYGKKPLPFQTLNFPVGTEQAIHSDAVHFNCHPNDGSLCGVWVALEDVDEDNGPLVYYPGSHRLPELYPVNFGLRPGAPNSEYEKKMAGFLKHLDFEPRKTVLRKGQALIWAANLLHGGDSVKDKTRTRLTQVTHYFFEGSEFYWTPLLSDMPAGKIVRRYPEAIGVDPAQKVPVKKFFSLWSRLKHGI